MPLNQRPSIEFTEIRHQYKVDGVVFPSVTTVLDIIEKPALIPWHLRLAKEYLMDRTAALRDINTPLELVVLLIEEAMAAGERARTLSAANGTKAHTDVEKVLKNMIRPEEAREEVRHVVDRFMVWCRQVGFKVLESELRVAHAAWMYAGTIDIIGEVNGKKTIVDLKTGKRLYIDSVGMQLSAYRHAYEYMYPDQPPITQMMGLRIGFEDHQLEHADYDEADYPFYREGFKNLLHIYHWQKLAKKREVKLHVNERAA